MRERSLAPTAKLSANVWRAAGATVVCEQVDRATALSTRQGLRDSTNFVKGDFMKQPFEDNTFDAVYQIEATAHAPDKVGCYKGRQASS